jgi:hypothetical protein
VSAVNEVNTALNSGNRQKVLSVFIKSYGSSIPQQCYVFMTFKKGIISVGKRK